MCAFPHDFDSITCLSSTCLLCTRDVRGGDCCLCLLDACFCLTHAALGFDWLTDQLTEALACTTFADVCRKNCSVAGSVDCTLQSACCMSSHTVLVLRAGAGGC
jgi:hypothetical protein